MQLDDLNQQHRDELCRISQQGMQQAAAMLSKLLRQPVGVQVADAWMSDRPQTEEPVQVPGVGISMAISGELNGGLLLFFPETSAEWISCQLLRKDRVADLLIEPACSTLKEVGNILASAFLASLENQLGLRSLPSPPQISRATADQLLQQKRSGTDPCLIVRTRLFSEQKESDPPQGAIYLFPEPESLQRLVARLRVD